MQVKTITTAAGVNEIDFGNDSSQSTAHFYWLKNLGDSILYVSANPNPIAEKDDVAELPAKGAVSVETDEGKIYVLGAGKVEIHRTNSKFCPFDWQSSGSGGGGSGSITVDSELSDTSTNPLQNKVTTAALKTKSDINHIHDISASGNPVIMDNLQGGVPFSEMVVSGKNLLFLSKSTLTANGITATANDDGSITLSGTATANTYIGMWDFLYARNMGAGKIAINAIDGQSNSTYYMGVDRREGNSYINRVAQSIIDNGIGEITQEDVENNRNFYVWVYIREGYTCNNLIIYPQLELGDTATEYESPITGRGLTVNVLGKNLIPYPYSRASGTYNGIELIVHDDGRFDMSGTATASFAILVFANGSKPIYLSGGQTYTISCNTPYDSSKFNLSARIYRTDGNYTPIIKFPTTFVAKEGEYLTSALWINSDVSVSAKNVELQLEIGSTATPYEPYNGTEYNITPDNNPYAVPNDICQLDGLNNISVSAGELSVVGVQKNAAIKKIWDKFASIGNDIVDLCSKISALESDTSASIEANGQEIVAVRHALDNISNDLSSVTDNVAINTSDIQTLKNGNEALRVEIDELRALIETA